MGKNLKLKVKQILSIYNIINNQVTVKMLMYRLHQRYRNEDIWLNSLINHKSKLDLIDLPSNGFQIATKALWIYTEIYERYFGYP